MFVEATIDQKDEDLYTENMRKTESCAKYANSILKFNEKSIVISGLAQLAVGAYLGILIQSRFFPHNYWKHILTTNWRKSFLRLVPAVLLLIPFGVINLVTPQTAPLGVLITFYTNIPCLGMFTCLFAFFDVLNVKFKLINEEVSPSIPIERAKHV